MSMARSSFQGSRSLRPRSPLIPSGSCLVSLIGWPLMSVTSVMPSITPPAGPVIDPFPSPSSTNGFLDPQLLDRPDLKVFLPPIGGLTIYIFGPPSYLSDQSKEVCLPF